MERKAALSPKTIVIKFGGAAMRDPRTSLALSIQLAALQQKKYRIVLVHGGGPEIDELLSRVGIPIRKESGLRITDEASMPIVEMVLSGKVNKQLVRQIGQARGRAVGLSGVDGRSILASKKRVSGVDLGRVGSVIEVDSTLFLELLQSGYLVVLASIGVDTNGETLNINADEVAAAVAMNLKAERLIILSDVPGVLGNYPDPESLIERMNMKEAQQLLESSTLAEGMIPKIASAIEVLSGGVREVCIADGRSPERFAEAIERDNLIGTRITKE